MTEITEFRPTDLVEKFATMERIVEAARSNFVEGVDFAQIDGWSKPTLLLPGAEKVMRRLNIVPVSICVSETEDWETPFFAYHYKVDLLQLNTKMIVGNGEGSCNSREASHGKMDQYFRANVCRKKAIKRATVSAVKQLAMLSGGYTVDIEDMQPPPARRKNA